METAILIVILAAFGEAVIEFLKPLLDPLQNLVEKHINLDEDGFFLYLSSALGLFIAFTFWVNALTSVGVIMPNDVADYFGVVGTGLAIGRGANAVHDFINRLGTVKSPLETEAVIAEEVRINAE